MSSTLISDIIIPEVFTEYFLQRTVEKSDFLRSGIATTDKQLQALLRGGGKTFNMPFFSDLSGRSEVLSDQHGLTPKKIGTSQDVSVRHLRGAAWAVNELSHVLAGADPMKAIADLVVEYWKREDQITLLKTLEGVFKAASMSDLIQDSSAEVMGVGNVLDAKQKLGDAAGGLKAIAMNSAVKTQLQKAQQIEYVEDAVTKIIIPRYLGYEVIEDDSLPIETVDTKLVATSYLFGKGALGYGETAAPISVETDRDSLKGEDVLIHRRQFMLHPRGVKFTSASVAGAAPDDAELTTGANWERVYDPKAIRLVQMKTLIGTVA